MAAKLSDRLIVVVADHAVLRMECGEFRAVVQQRPVRDQYTEGLPEKVRFQEHRPRVHAGFLIHGKKLLPFLIVEAHHYAVRLAALFRMPSPFGSFIPVLFLVHLYYGFSGLFHGTSAASGTHTAGRKQASRLRRGSLPRKGQGVFSGVTENPLSYSKDTLLLAVANKNPSGTDWEYTCLSPIPQVSVARYPSAAQKKDGAGVRYAHRERCPAAWVQS